MPIFWILISIIPLCISQYYVTTLSGDGAYGYRDGDGTNAEFGNPISVFIDPEGYCYVTDSGNNRIRKISPRGYVTTVAGNGNAESIDGQDIQASFNGCDGLSINSVGNIIVSDNGGHKIRSINASGYVSTIAGNGVPEYVDGPGIISSFNSPAGLAIDGFDNIYVADYGNHVIRKINSTGYVSTVAGSGNCGSDNGQDIHASFCYPTGVAIDSFGNIFVVDTGFSLVRKIDTFGYVSIYAGGGSRITDGPALKIQFDGLVVGITVDWIGNVYVSEPGKNKIRKITTYGYVSTIAGAETAGFLDGEGSSSKFADPQGLAIDVGGTIYVADFGNNAVRMITFETSTTTFFNPSPVAQSAMYSISVTKSFLSSITKGKPANFNLNKATMSTSNYQFAFSYSKPALIALSLVFNGPSKNNISETTLAAYIMIVLGSISGILFARYRIKKDEENRLRQLYSKRRQSNSLIKKI